MQTKQRKPVEMKGTKLNPKSPREGVNDHVSNANIINKDVFHVWRVCERFRFSGFILLLRNLEYLSVCLSPSHAERETDEARSGSQVL